MPMRPKGYRAIPKTPSRRARLKVPDPFYKRAQWRRVRAVVLAENPVCVREGCNALASHVDHIIPRSMGGADYALSNLQSLCHSCHSTKTGLERRDRA